MVEKHQLYSALCFFRCVCGNIVLLIQAFRKKFIIPEFDVFARKINSIYEAVQNNNEGKVAMVLLGCSFQRLFCCRAFRWDGPW